MAYNYVQIVMSHPNNMETEQAFLLRHKSLTRSVPEAEFYPLCVNFKTGGVILKHSGDIVLGNKKKGKKDSVRHHTTHEYSSCRFKKGGQRVNCRGGGKQRYPPPSTSIHLSRNLNNFFSNQVSMSDLKKKSFPQNSNRKTFITDPEG